MTDHPIHAALYDPMMGLFDRAGLAEERRRLVADARGRVLEIGAGTGRNLPLYRDIDSLTVVEPDGSMRKRLLDRMAASTVPVEVHESAAEDTGLSAGTFDTVVCSLVLCTVDDVDASLREMARVLAPGGQVLFLEHVRLPGWKGAVQRTVTPAWKRVAGGCHLDRDTLCSMRQAGLVITDCHRSGAVVRGRARPRTTSDGEASA